MIVVGPTPTDALAVPIRDGGLVTRMGVLTEEHMDALSSWNDLHWAAVAMLRSLLDDAKGE